MLRLIFGLLAIAVGLLWIGQGFGMMRWPSSSFMIDQKFWSIMGGLMVALGVYLLRRRI